MIYETGAGILDIDTIFYSANTDLTLYSALISSKFLIVTLNAIIP